MSTEVIDIEVGQVYQAMAGTATIISVAEIITADTSWVGKRWFSIQEVCNLIASSAWIPIESPDSAE